MADRDPLHLNHLMVLPMSGNGHEAYRFARLLGYHLGLIVERVNQNQFTCWNHGAGGHYLVSYSDDAHLEKVEYFAHDKISQEESEADDMD